MCVYCSISQGKEYTGVVTTDLDGLRNIMEFGDVLEMDGMHEVCNSSDCRYLLTTTVLSENANLFLKVRRVLAQLHFVKHVFHKGIPSLIGDERCVVLSYAFCVLIGVQSVDWGSLC